MTINIDIKEKLAYLANISETEHPFITLYLNVHSNNIYERGELNRIFIKNAFNDYIMTIQDDKEKLDNFRADEDKINYFLQNEVESRAHGVAIFACSALGVFETFQSVMPFENSFGVNGYPHLKQLAIQADEYEDCLAVMLDSKKAEIFEIKLGGFIMNKSIVKHAVHRFHKQGGWSQMRYQRHIENQKDNHYSKVAEVVAQYSDEKNYSNIILIGQHSEVQRFMEKLPERVTKKVISKNTLPARENINEIIETILDDLNKSEKVRETKMVSDIINNTQAGGMMTMGIQDTINLAREGRVSTLVFAEDIVYKGWRCENCYYINKQQHIPGCPKCNGNTKNTDLVEDAIRLTLKDRGTVEVVKNESAYELERHEGIGAILRY